MPKIRGRQIRDISVVSEDEAAATYKSTLIADSSEFPLSISSVDSSTSTVTVSSTDLTELELISGDVVEITNSDGADGTYTVNSVTGENTFTVNESISDATSGDLNIYMPTGATLIGVDNRNWSILTSSILQSTLDEIDQLIAESTAWDSETVNLPGNENFRFAQFKVQSGEEFKVYRAGIQLRDGSATSNIEVQVYDVTNSQILYQTSSKSILGTPLVSAGGTLDIALRVVNNSNMTEQVLAHINGIRG